MIKKKKKLYFYLFFFSIEHPPSLIDNIALDYRSYVQRYGNG